MTGDVPGDRPPETVTGDGLRRCAPTPLGSLCPKSSPVVRPEMPEAAKMQACAPPAIFGHASGALSGHSLGHHSRHLPPQG